MPWPFAPLVSSKLKNNTTLGGKKKIQELPDLLEQNQTPIQPLITLLSLPIKGGIREHQNLPSRVNLGWWGRPMV